MYLFSLTACCEAEDHKKADTAKDHEETQELTHGLGGDHETQLRIRFPREFNDITGNTVPDEIQSQEIARKGSPFSERPEHDEKDDTFTERLVELRRMSKLMGDVEGEIHSPRDIRNPSVKFAIDEISDATEGVPEGDDGAEKVGQMAE